MDLKKIYNRNKKLIYIIFIAIAVILLISFLLVSFLDNSEAGMPIYAYCTFQGKYKIADGEWATIKNGEHISATKGDVTLKGYFKLHNPVTNEITGNVGKGTMLLFYFNHINVKVQVPGQNDVVYSYEDEKVGKAGCGVVWEKFTYMGDGIQEVTIVLHNPHVFGNESAVDDFLGKLDVYLEDYTEAYLIRESETDKAIGIAIIVSAFVLFGIAMFSMQIKLPYAKEFWCVGAVLLSAGLYYIFSHKVTIVNTLPMMLNTSVRELSRALYMFFMMATFSLLIEGKNKKILKGLTIFNGITVAVCVFISLVSKIKFYDTILYWSVATLIVWIAFAVCMILNFKNSNLFQKIINLLGLVIVVAYSIDFVAMLFAWWQETISQSVFLLVYVIILIIVLRVIPQNIQSRQKARQLEYESRKLKNELEESKIAIMLSQIQPHFLYNTLNTIYHLCDVDVEKAKTAVDSFSEYLRNNIDSLNESTMVEIDTEIRHVNTYLNLEKIRFADELNVEYDLQVKGFKVPVLSVQPIVENAVKHGTSKKRGGGTVKISTRENNDFYEIIVVDTGVGFEFDVNNISEKSIGIKNVMQRLKNMCDGQMNIESEIGKGTTVTITIPKEGA